MKKTLSVLLILGLMFALETCTFASNAEMDAVVIKASLHSSPETAQNIGLKAAGDYIREKTNGKIDLQVYDAGSLSPGDSIIIDTQNGQIDMCLPGPSFMGQFYAPITIMGAPYLFRDKDHLYNTVESGLVDELFDGFESAADLVLLDYWILGVRNVSSNVKSTTPEEFGGVKMRAPTANMYVAAIKGMGAIPTALPITDTYLALQTGTVDAQENPLNLILSMKFYEVQKYIIKTEHMLDGFAVAINKRKWESIPEDMRQIVIDGIKHGKSVSDEVIATADAEAINVFSNAGLEIVEIDKSLFTDRIKEALTDVSASWPEGLYDKIADL